MNDVVTEEAPEHVERRSLIIDAPAAEIFDLLADPRRHHTFDGSGTVKESRMEAPERLEMGSKFGMKMKQYGMPYRITSEVVEFEENERIAWRHMGRHVWRYTLEPAEGGTKVTEEFDGRPSPIKFALRLAKVPQKNAEAIEQTLVRLRDAVTAS